MRSWAEGGAGGGELGCREGRVGESWVAGSGGGQLACTRSLGWDTAPHVEGHRKPMKRHKKDEKSRGGGSSAQRRKG